MKKKLVIFDIDGTLLHSKKISQRNVNAILAVEEMGHTIALASGRNSASMYPFAKQLGLANGQAYLVGLNGAEIFSLTQNGDVHYFWEHSFDQELTKTVIKAAWRHRLDFFAYTQNPHLNYVANRFSPFTLAMRFARKNKVLKVKHDFSNLHLEVKKFLFFGKQKRMTKFLKELEPYDLSIFKWSKKTDPQANIEVNVPLMDKLNGIKEIAERLGFAQEDVIYFGDGSNDVQALGWAGIGVAMGNAKPEIAKHAKEQTTHVKKDGVAQWLENNLLTEKGKD